MSRPGVARTLGVLIVALIVIGTCVYLFYGEAVNPRPVTQPAATQPLVPSPGIPGEG